MSNPRSYSSDNLRNVYVEPAQRELDACWSRCATAARMRWILTFLMPNGMNRRRVADALGVPRASVSNWERGWAIPNRTRREALGGLIGAAPEAMRVFDVGQAPGRGYGSTGLRRALCMLSSIRSDFPMTPAVNEFGHPHIVAEDPFVRWGIERLAPVWTDGDPLDMARARLTLSDPALDGGWREVPSGELSTRRSELRAAAADPAARRLLLKHRYGERALGRLERAGATVRDVARELGRKPSDAARLFDGGRMPSRAANEIVARVAGVAPETLMPFDIATPAEALHALLDVACAVGARPVANRFFAGVDFALTPLAAPLAKWSGRLHGTRSGGPFGRPRTA